MLFKAHNPVVIREEEEEEVEIASSDVVESNLSSPTFEEAFTKASGTLPSSEKQIEPEEEVQLDSESPDKPEPEQEDKDTPLDQFDPEKLSPELKQVWKNMQKGFTQGRQKDREELNQLKKELEDLRSSKTVQEPEKQLTQEEYIDQLVDKKVTEKKLESYREQAISDYDSLDVRLTRPTDDKPNDKYDEKMDKQVGAELDVLLQEHIDKTGSELGFDYKTHGKRLIAEWDQYIQSKVDAFLAKQRDMAKKGERSFEKTNPKGAAPSVKPSGNMSLEQALNAAVRKHHA